MSKLLDEQTSHIVSLIGGYIYESYSTNKREELIAALERTDIKCINEYGVEVIVQKKED